MLLTAVVVERAEGVEPGGDPDIESWPALTEIMVERVVLLVEPMVEDGELDSGSPAVAW